MFIATSMSYLIMGFIITRLTHFGKDKLQQTVKNKYKYGQIGFNKERL